MGTNNYTTKNPGDIIAPEDPNQYKTGLTGDVVPRNTSGVPTDIFGSLGSTVYRWLHTFTTKLYIGLTASGLSIEEDAGDLIFLIGGVEKARLKNTGFTLDSVRARGYGESSSTVNYVVTTGTLADVTNATFSITTNGGDVFISLKSATSSSPCFIAFLEDGVSGNGGSWRLYLQRDGVDIAVWDGTMSAGPTDQSTMTIPGSAINYLDHGLAAGTYTYKLRVSFTGNGITLQIGVAKFFGKELL